MSNWAVKNKTQEVGKMALANKNVGGTPGTAAPAKVKKGGKTEANAEITAKGNEIIAAMSEEERQKLGSLSHTLHFQRLLGLSSQKSSRKVGPNETKDCSTPVGVEFISDIEIQVPRLPVTVNKNTAIDPEKDITYETVKPGQVFEMTYYEFMFLIIRDEYAGLFSVNGDPRGGYFSPKLPAFWRGEAKLPTPTINFRSGSVKASMFDIDQKGPNGWEIKPGYERYAELLKKSTPQRASGKKATVPPPVVISKALQKLLKVN